MTNNHTRPLLVTGASGLLGANFLHTASQNNHPAVGIYHQHPIKQPGFRTQKADLTKYDAVSRIVTQIQPRCIIHCAALTHVDYCQQNPEQAQDINVNMTRHLAHLAHQINAVFVYISTDSVFDGKRGNYCETDPTAPVNTYAQTKLLGEQVCQSEQPNSLIIRTNIYGWNWQPKMSLAEWILARLNANEEVPGFDDVTFSPILVNDLSKIILAMLTQNLQGIYHVCGSESLSKYAFACAIAKMFKKEIGHIKAIAITNATLHAPRPKHTSLDTSKITNALNEKMPDITSGLLQFKHLQNTLFK